MGVVDMLVVLDGAAEVLRAVRAGHAFEHLVAGIRMGLGVKEDRGVITHA